VSAKDAETRSAVGAVGAGNHTRSGAEQRARTTVVVNLGAAQNGTSGAHRQVRSPAASNLSSAGHFDNPDPTSARKLGETPRRSERRPIRMRPNRRSDDARGTASTGTFGDATTWMWVCTKDQP
jgi:hypothetical protein